MGFNINPLKNDKKRFINFDTHIYTYIHTYIHT